MYANNHLLVLSQSDFIQRQLCTAITEATAPRSRNWPALLSPLIVPRPLALRDAGDFPPKAGTCFGGLV
jgi:hypothetical protein